MQVVTPSEYTPALFKHPANFDADVTSNAAAAIEQAADNIQIDNEAIASIKRNVAIDNRSVDKVIDSNLTSDQESAFFVADIAQVYAQHVQWRRMLPRIEPFYAVKCNPDPVVLKLLASLGTGFDCASKNEIQSVLDLGVDPSRLIYANPCKASSYIRHAAQNDVRMMTFDNANELTKIKRHFPHAQLVLRILTDDSKSLCKLGLKFGAALENTLGLLTTARDMGLDVIGVSFHVGSGCYDEHAFADAVARAKTVFNQAKSVGFSPYLLDVGGGFGHENFCAIASVLSDAIEQHFPDPSSVRIIGEPGRYYVSKAFTLATNVIAKRRVESESDEKAPSFMYYANDGVYGAFNCILFDHQVVYPRVFRSDAAPDATTFESSVWGPTCDSIDCIRENVTLPELQVGDWIAWDNMGAYTICAASRFNGMETSDVLYTWSGEEKM